MVSISQLCVSVYSVVERRVCLQQEDATLVALKVQKRCSSANQREGLATSAV